MGVELEIKSKDTRHRSFADKDTFQRQRLILNEAFEVLQSEANSIGWRQFGLFAFLALALGLILTYVSSGLLGFVFGIVWFAAFAIVAGFAVFSVAGYFSKQSGQALEDMSIDGPMLAFVTYPAGLSMIGKTEGMVLSVLFFFTFFLLGIPVAQFLANKF